LAVPHALCPLPEYFSDPRTDTSIWCLVLLGQRSSLPCLLPLFPCHPWCTPGVPQESHIHSVVNVLRFCHVAGAAPALGGRPAHAGRHTGAGLPYTHGPEDVRERGCRAFWTPGASAVDLTFSPGSALSPVEVQTPVTINPSRSLHALTVYTVWAFFCFFSFFFFFFFPEC